MIAAFLNSFSKPVLGLVIMGLSAQLALQGAQPHPAKPDKIQPADARTLIHNLLAQTPAENSEFYGLLKIRRADRKRIEVPVRYRLVLQDESWTGVYETKPAGPIAAEKLVVTHRPGGTNAYFLAREPHPSDGLPEPVRLDPGQLAQPFAGSDFWIGDLGLEFLHWPDQRLVDKTYRKTRWCYVVESRNPQPATGMYARVLSWIDQETGGLIMAQGYDPQNKLLKVFSVVSVKKGQIKDVEIRNEQTDTRTYLEFNLQLD